MRTSSVRLSRLIYIGNDEINSMFVTSFYDGVMFGCQPSRFVLQLV